MHRWKLSGTMGLAHGFHFHNNKKEYLILKIRYSFCVQNKRKQNHRQHQWHPYIVKVGKKTSSMMFFIIVGKVRDRGAARES